MKKRGYFFTIDVSIAMIVIVVGFLLIWAFYVSETSKEQSYFYAQDAIEMLSNTPIYSVTSAHPYIRALVKDGNITDLDSTLLEQIAMLYIADTAACRWDACSPNISMEMTRRILQDSVPEQYGVNVVLNDTILYEVNATTGTWQNGSDILISAKKIAVVVIDKVTLSDPYLLEVRVWR